MKWKLVFLIVNLFISSIAMSAVGNEDLDRICKLTETGQFEKALEGHLWFHEESKKTPGMAGVRLSYAITAWIKLGKKYPPAIEALQKIRDEDKKILLSGKGSFDNFHDLSSINQGLNQEGDTLELFLTLDSKYPDQAKSYYIVAEKLLIAHKRYDICKKYIGDPVIKYERLRHVRELNLSFAKTDPKMNDPEFLEYTDSSFVDGVMKLIEVLIAIDNREMAVEIQRRALSYFPHKSIKHAIP